MKVGGGEGGGGGCTAGRQPLTINASRLQITVSVFARQQEAIFFLYNVGILPVVMG